MTGYAGTGKSFTTKEIVRTLQNEGLNVAVLGTTGIAAMNVGGATIHSFFAIPIKYDGSVIETEDCRFVRRETRMMWSRVDAIVIDEVSMLRADQLDAIEWTLLKNGCRSLSEIQLILVGDLKQLPPVVTDNSNIRDVYDSEFFYSAEVYKEMSVSKVNLTTIHRQSDPEFIENLNKVRDGEQTPKYFDNFVVDKNEHKGIVLCPYKNTVADYNRRSLSKLKSKRVVLEAQVSGDVNFKQLNLEQRLVLKDGAEVMHTVNNGPLVNGSIGTLSIGGENNDNLSIILKKRYRT